MQEMFNFAKIISSSSSMKRICFLTDSIFSFGGVQRVTAVIAKELSKEYDVTVVTFDKPSDKETSLYGLQEADIKYRFFSYPEVKALKNKVCKAYSYAYRRLLPQTRLTSDLYNYSSFPSEKRDALAKELIQGHYDVIIGDHAPLAIRLAGIKNQLNNSKLIGWVHNSFEALYGKDSLYIGQELKRHYVYQLRKLDATVVLCQHDAESYRLYDRMMNPTVIYNPLTLVPGEQSKGTSKKFLAVGRFSHLHKGFDLLIDAFHLFAQKDKEWSLDIVGEGPEEALYRKKITDYGLEERIFLHPFTNNIQQYYSNAQIYVLSSRWEGFGLVIVEAMAHGLPVISSDLPTSKEIMGELGIYFENGNINQLAQRLGESTSTNWQETSEKVMKRADDFAVSTIIRQWKELIE